ncbi:MAG: DNA-directed RNA polymerase subunit delta [Erysipelotrichaceae bacterium]|nr:DNA-directed RNA polymerase subunit delta [Erysipelotrichaceae bacterium]
MAKQSMMDVAYECLSKAGSSMEFLSLFNEVSGILEIPSDKIRRKKAQFYSELSMDSRFVSFENNCWDLKTRHTFNETFIDTSVMEDENEDEEEEEEIEMDEESSNKNNLEEDY